MILAMAVRSSSNVCLISGVVEVVVSLWWMKVDLGASQLYNKVESLAVAEEQLKQLMEDLCITPLRID